NSAGQGVHRSTGSDEPVWPAHFCGRTGSSHGSIAADDVCNCARTPRSSARSLSVTPNFESRVFFIARDSCVFAASDVSSHKGPLRAHRKNLPGEKRLSGEREGDACGVSSGLREIAALLVDATRHASTTLADIHGERH